MASVKITELNPSGPLTGSEVLPIVQGNDTVKTTVQEIGSFTRPYSVYTALLTQSGGNDPQTWSKIDNGSLVIGVTYEINNYKSGDDFTNVGAPSNANGVQFVATGTTAASWVGSTELDYNNGAPIVTVLKNTIGNIWFTYDIEGVYQINSNGLFVENKTFYEITQNNNGGGGGNANFLHYVINRKDENVVFLNTLDVDLVYQTSRGADTLLYNTPIEIRVYK
jgi:hypothetical protein